MHIMFSLKGNGWVENGESVDLERVWPIGGDVGGGR